jgi:hypothetical protein
MQMAAIDQDDRTYLDWLFGAESAVCDHVLEDNGSYAGPDSGYESLRCKRCTEEFHVHYY